MDAETQAKLVKGMHAELGEAYLLVVGLLERLPIPMLLPRDPAADPRAAILAMSRAWEVADYQAGMPKLAVGRVRDMILAWLTAYELAVAALEHGPAEWRLRAFEDRLLRVKACAHYTGDYLESRGHRRPGRRSRRGGLRLPWKSGPRPLRLGAARSLPGS